MNGELIEAMKIVAMCQLGTAIVFGVTVYAVVKVIATGRPAWFERKTNAPAVVHRIDA